MNALAARMAGALVEAPQSGQTGREGVPASLALAIGPVDQIPMKTCDFDDQPSSQGSYESDPIAFVNGSCPHWVTSHQNLTVHLDMLGGDSSDKG
jgi:hypothetical protein